MARTISRDKPFKNNETELNEDNMNYLRVLSHETEDLAKATDILAKAVEVTANNAQSTADEALNRAKQHTHPMNDIIGMPEFQGRHFGLVDFETERRPLVLPIIMNELITDDGFFEVSSEFVNSNNLIVGERYVFQRYCFSTHPVSAMLISKFAPLGTASTRNISDSGNATTEQVVLGSDTRLTNERAPTGTITINNITRNLRGNPSFTIHAQLPDRIENVRIIDNNCWDNAYESGWYYSHLTNNSPVDDNNEYIGFVVSHPMYIIQKVFDITNSVWHTRMYSSTSGWSKWNIDSKIITKRMPFISGSFDNFNSGLTSNSKYASKITVESIMGAGFIPSVDLFICGQSVAYSIRKIEYTTYVDHMFWSGTRIIADVQLHIYSLGQQELSVVSLAEEIKGLGSLTNGCPYLFPHDFEILNAQATEVLIKEEIFDYD